MITNRGLSQKCKHIYHLKSVYVTHLNNKLKKKNIMVLIEKNHVTKANIHS